ncbi:uncharacterized protein JCM6883_000517 [Sporobolomyces salmoneus]|uniref:uncharacterized protein n=1 Tax=Sporobolomyces salmoneus TaxID=183962 RepID=UPI003170812E
MQHRAAYQPPNTPSFTIETTDQDSPSSPSPSSSRFPPISRSMQNGPKLSPNTGNGGGGGDYFAGEKLPIAFPPSQRSPTSSRFLISHSNDSSSVHLPLLSDDRPSSSSPPASPTSHSHSPSRRRTTSNSSSPTGWLTSLATSRTRIHPLVLVPVFVFGIVFSAAINAGGGKEYDKMGRSAMTSLKSFGGHWTTSSTSPSSSPNYTLHSSGHLFLSPSSLYPSSESSSLRHPIHELILNSSLAWTSKLSRQSQDLRSAVIEYKRRFNGRNPPKGFDQWFKFAQDNKVVLIDEFDQTFRDVEMFWSLPPSVIRSRAEKLQGDASTFTMLINGEDGGDGEVEIVGAHAGDGRAKDQKKLMKRWAKYVKGGKRRDGKKGFEGVNITMAAHDGPSVMMDEKSRKRHLDAARKGKLLTEDEYEEVDEDAALWGFPLACPVNSRLRRAYDGLEIDNLPKGPSFVANHVETMNLCSNPEWQYLHGFTSWPGMRPQILRPLFSFAKTSLHSDILLTPLEQYWDREPYDPTWEEKPYNKAVWRGSTTGVWFDRGTWWRNSQRVRLWFMGKDSSGSKNVRFSTEGLETPIGVENLVEKQVPTQDLMERYVDFAFTGREGQCSVEDGSCEAVRKLFDFQRTFGWNEANEYKYMLDLDGNAWSGRFHRLLSTNSAVLKSTIFPEWYAGWIQPWVHYIPIKIDYTDLFDVMAFFSGDLDGQNHHEHLAKQIADNGKDYTERFWRYEDMEAYFFRLTLEWARVSADDRESMDYIHPGLE